MSFQNINITSLTLNVAATFLVAFFDFNAITSLLLQMQEARGSW